MLGIKVDADKRIFGFDLLRALAIFFVMHGHGRHLLTGTIIEGFPWFKLPHGVDIFFVISGFLIGYSFIVNSNKTDGKTQFKTVTNFWKRSMLRIFPNYYLLVVVNYILVNSQIINGSTDMFPMIRFLTFTQNLYYPFYEFFWESWSLAVQEWFYLLFPLLLLLYSRFFKVKFGVLFFSLGFIAFSIWYRYSISDIQYDQFWWDVSYRKVTASRIDSIFYGVIAAWIRYYFPKFWNKNALLLFALGITLYIINVNIPKSPNDFYTQVFYLSVSPLCIALWFPLIDKIKSYKTKIGEAITVFSILSYAIYLTNMLLIQIINKNFTNFMSGNASIKYLSYIALCVLISYLIYILYENPLSKLGNKLLKTRKMMYKRIRERI
ncbi:MAG: acyltransferase [Bacteroidales bacterium]|nr:acyltransferase [Bacteroidales bacterium]